MVTLAARSLADEPAAGQPPAPRPPGDLVVLVLAVLVPSLVNLWGVQAFAVPKATLIRLAALVVLVQWAVAGGPGVSWRDRAGRIVLIAAGAYLLTTAISTAGSIDPLTSLLGSYDRLQGLLTLLACAGLGLAAGGAGRPTRLVDALLLGSVLPCLYALIQQARLDPLPWLDRTAGPPSTLGTSTELGGYLAMMAPLTLARGGMMAARLAGRSADWRPRGRADWCFVGLVLLFGLQLATVGVIAVRGALLGLLAGLGLLAALLWWRQSQVRAPLLAGLAALLLLVAVAVPVAAAGRLRGLAPSVDRLAPGELGDDSARSRLLIWQAAFQTMAHSGPRLLIGFGPETQALALEPRYPLELANRLADLRIDRAHDALLDQLLTTGLLGATAALGLVLAIGLAGARALERAQQPWLPAALLAALGTHLVEQSVAYDAATTELVAWLLVGAGGRGHIAPGRPGAAADRPESVAGRPGLPAGVGV